MKINFENVYFVLVEPQNPGNIGAAARALKTMGFGNLVLVNPCWFDVPEARWLAHASQDILDAVKVLPSLPEAIKDVQVVVATTQRNREYHLPYYTPTEISQKLIPSSQEFKVALVFGRERSGLTNEELQCCHLFSTIPAATAHPSLNLSQAVMLYAYELFKNSFEEEKKFQWNLASYAETESVYLHLRESLEKVNFVPIDNWEKFIMRFRRFFARSYPEARDVRLLHKILQTFDDYIAELERKLQDK